MSTTGLAAGLGFGIATEFAKRTLGLSDSKTATAPGDNNLVLNEANIERVVSTLCKVRGAALKLGQMISLQGEQKVHLCYLGNQHDVVEMIY